MTDKGRIIPLLLLLGMLGLSACSGSGTESASGQFRTLAQESKDSSRYLPEDLPIPNGAGITYSEGKVVEGTKSSMLIYKTDESMSAIGSTYQKYVKDNALEQGTQIVDGNNMILSGKVPGSYSYSIIGSRSSSRAGDTEIIVTWIEN